MAQARRGVDMALKAMELVALAPNFGGRAYSIAFSRGA
jgi:hypothetical protein